MISDRELNKLVAAKVMGWHVGAGNKHHYWYDSESKYAANVRDYLPSRDAGLALEAAMKASGESNIVVGPAFGGGWFAMWTNRSSIPGRRWNQRSVSAHSATIPRALCLASLRASGVEVQDDADEAAERQGEGG